MRKLKITDCKDGAMWYAGLVGKIVPLLREESDCYLSREPAGYTNIVRKGDAKPVWVDYQGREFFDGDCVDCACRQAVMILSEGVSKCEPIGPVPLKSSHSVARCTFDPGAIGTNDQGEPELFEHQTFVSAMSSIRAGLNRAHALLWGKGTNGQ